MADKVLHALAFDDRARIIATSARDTVQTAVRTHDAEATAGAAFGRSLIAARLLQASVKKHERVTLQIQGGGPLGLLLARALPSGDVYGTVGSPHVHLPPRPDGKLDVGRAVGTDGYLMVSRDTGNGKPYSGTTELVSGEIGDDIAHYLATSEQIRSATGMGVLMGPDGEVRSAGGFLVQVLGGLTDEELTQLELRIITLSDISRDLEDGIEAEGILERLTDGNHRVIAEAPIRYHCPNDREYYRDRLLSLGREDVADIFESDEQISLTCEYTKNVYEFRRDEFADLLDDHTDSVN